MEASWLYTTLSFFLLILAFKYSTRKKRTRVLPPSPVSVFPILGHLHLLKPPLHQSFHKLSEKLGPIFSLRLGNRLMVVVTSQALVEECFTKNDIVLANRPRLLIGKYIGYNYTSIILAPYGDHWRNLRRLTTIEVFSTARLNKFAGIRQDEVRLQVQKMSKMSKQGSFVQVELKRVFLDLTFNNIMRMVAGKRYFGENEDSEEAKVFQENMDQLLKAASVAHPVNFFPMLKWLDYTGYEKKLARLCKRLDSFLQRLIDERRGKNSNDTMIDHLLSLQESEPEYYSDMIIKGIILVMLLAGTETASTTMEWGMAALLNHPDILEKARAELDNVVGSNRLVNEADMAKLPYLQNIISETYRLFPAAPLLVSHEASADCKIGGYDIPERTILFGNAWAIHRDPAIWDNPTRFMPERFEAGDITMSKLITFGMGRRSCPGSGLAQRVIELTLGSFIQCFEWERIDEAMVDMNEGLRGNLLPKAIPLEARCRARDVLHNVLLDSI